MEEGKLLKHVCKFCKKRFGCGRSLGGHIRCHLPKPVYKLRQNPKKTWRIHQSSSATSSSSEIETENFRLMGNNNNNNNSHSSVSEVVEEEQNDVQEKEIDVAMCLIMLSRDVGPWGKSSNKRKRRVKKVEGKDEDDATVVVFTAVNGEKMDRKEVKLKEVEDSGNGGLLNDQSFDLSEKFENVGSERVKIEENREMGNFDVENAVKNSKNSDQRSKFECTTCNKMFHSYQALGGHKASHKKLLLGENSSKEILSKGKNHVFTDISLGTCSKVSKKIVQKHECPFCDRVFGTGQALGGHKRSHLLGSNNNNEVKVSEDDVIERLSSSSENRDVIIDLIDLNLPPKHVQEEGDNAISLVGLIKPYWWVENPHKNQPFLSLIPN